MSCWGLAAALLCAAFVLLASFVVALAWVARDRKEDRDEDGGEP